MALEKDGVAFNYIADGNKNITQLIDMSSGSIANRYDYSPFGQLIADVETVENPFKFSSEYAEKETGLVYYNYRYYNPVNGKWLKRDPIQEAGGFNIYGFTYGNPISYIDNLGLIINFGATIQGIANGIMKEIYSDSEKEAIEKQGKSANKKSKKEDIEYCGAVCKTCLDGKIKFFTTMGKGSLYKCEPANFPCPGKSETVAYWHTHGNDDPDSDIKKQNPFYIKPQKGEPVPKYDKFSDGDKDFSKKQKVPFYLFTPQDNIKKYDPSTDAVTEHGKISYKNKENKK
ncbi:RHS repeat-associated core domain-containing protein [Lentisphaerota bacterium WC36G]|nr:DUF4329 domain-containing protein [Lentisphaerae bacterium WC36]